MNGYVNCYERVLSLRSKESFPLDWAVTQSNLGMALNDLGTRLEGDEGNRCLYEAVEARSAASAIYAEKELPLNWAETQNSHGMALSHLGRGIEGADGVRLIEIAVSCFDACLRIEKELNSTYFHAEATANKRQAERDLERLRQALQ